MPQVSVIMSVYNQRDEKALMAAVNSILTQSFKDFEFIIFDDGSDDECSILLEKIAKLDSRIRLVSKKKNRGLAFSLNCCIFLARGKYIARMDADDISYPERLTKQVEYLELHPEISWVGTNIHLFKDNVIWGQRVFPEEPQKDDYLKYSPYAHPTVMYRASIFDENIGYITTKDTLRCEDYELFMRFRAAGIRGANLQETLFAYCECEESYRKRNFRTRFREAKVRFRSFKLMGILFPKGIIYVMRPIVACLVPHKLLAWKKQKESSMYYKLDVVDEIEKNEKEISIGTDCSA